MRQVLFHPLLARRLGIEVCAIDLSDELEQLRDRGLPCIVVAARTDTLTPPSLCRRSPSSAGATTASSMFLAATSGFFGIAPAANSEASAVASLT